MSAARPSRAGAGGQERVSAGCPGGVRYGRALRRSTTTVIRVLRRGAQGRAKPTGTVGPHSCPYAAEPHPGWEGRWGEAQRCRGDSEAVAEGAAGGVVVGDGDRDGGGRPEFQPGAEGGQLQRDYLTVAFVLVVVARVEGDGR